MGFHHDVAAPGQIADQDAPGIADTVRDRCARNCATTFWTAFTCVPPLCENAAEPTQGCRGLWRNWRSHPRIAKVPSAWRRDAGGRQRFFHLQRHIGNDAGQIAIAGAFAVTIDRALHMGGARFEAGQGIGDSEADVIVGVNAESACSAFARASAVICGNLFRQDSRHSCRRAR